jgi:ATP-dependent DNA helicase RecG
MPAMEEDGGGFIIKLFKDRFSKEQLQQLGLNDRQIKAVLYVKEKGKITNSEYQKINEISERTSSREISELVKANILEQAGSFGAGSYYQLKTP